MKHKIAKKKCTCKYLHNKKTSIYAYWFAHNTDRNIFNCLLVKSEKMLITS